MKDNQATLFQYGVRAGSRVLMLGSKAAISDDGDPAGAPTSAVRAAFRSLFL